MQAHANSRDILFFFAHKKRLTHPKFNFHNFFNENYRARSKMEFFVGKNQKKKKHISSICKRKETIYFLKLHITTFCIFLFLDIDFQTVLKVPCVSVTLLRIQKG